MKMPPFLMLFGNVIAKKVVYIMAMIPDDFYDNLNKSKFTPPKAVFRGAWRILYVLMTAAFVLLLLSPNSFNKLMAIFLFLVQLVLNFNWSCVFFGERQIKKAFWICLSLLIIVIVMTVLIFKQSLWAGYLLVPYCIWLILATYLNYYVMVENPSD